MLKVAAKPSSLNGSPDVDLSHTSGVRAPLREAVGVEGHLLLPLLHCVLAFEEENSTCGSLEASDALGSLGEGVGGRDGAYGFVDSLRPVVVVGLAVKDDLRETGRVSGRVDKKSEESCTYCSRRLRVE